MQPFSPKKSKLMLEKMVFFSRKRQFANNHIYAHHEKTLFCYKKYLFFQKAIDKDALI